ncbi:hypothetical protein STEG23_000810 [Scotinomys teguina]
MQPGRTTNTSGGTMEVVAAAPRCQLLLIMLMAAMLGMKVSPVLVQRTVTRTIELQESIGKGTLLLLVVSNLLLWQKAASVPECHTEDGGCWDPLVETFNGAINRAQNIHDLAEHMYQEFFFSEFSSRPFLTLLAQLMMKNQTVFRARTYCHDNITNPSGYETENINMKTKKYLKMMINYVGAWSSPLYHLVIELSAMQDAPESMLSKANEIEEKNKELLDDLRWILTKTIFA